MAVTPDARDPYLSQPFCAQAKALWRDPRLSVTAKAVYALLSVHRRLGSFEASISVPAIARHLALHTRTVYRLLSELEGEGWIWRISAGAGRRNVYLLLDPEAPFRLQPEHPGRISGGAERPKTRAPGVTSPKEGWSPDVRGLAETRAPGVTPSEREERLRKRADPPGLFGAGGPPGNGGTDGDGGSEAFVPVPTILARLIAAVGGGPTIAGEPHGNGDGGNGE